MAGTKHQQLSQTAINWLYSRGCQIFANEVPTGNGVADAVGIKRDATGSRAYYIEAKASRSDLICKKQKEAYRYSIGDHDAWCWRHDPSMYRSMFEGDERSKGWEQCEACLKAKTRLGDTGIDYYYLIVADDVTVEPELYPMWGVINERGVVVRKAKRMRRDGDVTDLTHSIAHVLVYKAFGKMYMPA